MKSEKNAIPNGVAFFFELQLLKAALSPPLRGEAANKTLCRGFPRR